MTPFKKVKKFDLISRPIDKFDPPKILLRSFGRQPATNLTTRIVFLPGNVEMAPCANLDAVWSWDFVHFVDLPEDRCDELCEKSVPRTLLSAYAVAETLAKDTFSGQGDNESFRLRDRQQHGDGA